MTAAPAEVSLGVSLGASVGSVAAAAAIGLLHTAAGPDHYLPFVMLGRARRWSRGRTLMVTLACGLGHVGSSMVLAAAVLLLGVAAADVESLERLRGGLAGQAMLAFGLAYGAWGVRSAVRERRELQLHRHGDHVHLHRGGLARHRHGASHGPSAHGARHGTTFWALFLIFVLGPCEPLIPLLVVPAGQGHLALAAAMALVFGVVTLATMVTLTLLALGGIERLPLARLERWTHAMAGGVIALAGAGMCLGG